MTGDHERRIHILAPVGRDAELARDGLRARGLVAAVHRDIDSLCAAIPHGAGAILLTQEALGLAGFPRLILNLRQQPPWSDLPLVVLVGRGHASGPLAGALMMLDDHTNATLLERPVRLATIVRAVESALRSRLRQYELRAQLAARTRAEEAERHARAQAEAALRARDEFLSIAAHELRNPVAGVSGAAQMLRRARASGWLTEERLDAYLEMLETSGRHLAALTEDLLDVSRLQRGELPFRPETTDLSALVWSALQSREWDGRRLHLQAEKDVSVVVDPNRIRQVVLNLLDNALKYSPGGEPVDLRLRHEDGGILLRVEDAGIGLPPGAQESIFTPFSRAENAARANIPGLGLGLYLSRRIAEQHGGRLWAESEGEGRGTRMYLWLPIGNDESGGSPQYRQE